MDVKEIRRLNARHLAERKFSRQLVAKRLGYADNNYLNQLLTGHSQMGDRTARKFEKSLDMPNGWMDQPHPELWGETPEEMLAFSEQLLSNLSTADLSRLIDRALTIIRGRSE
ncbi:MAG: hypothetical protein CMI02_09635 [Oceanospirillaceae bacterium]|mgnify:CR=1 FL=1|nr:hypothetical protein [Oceanospirillaceae bacterium]